MPSYGHIFAANPLSSTAVVAAIPPMITMQQQHHLQQHQEHVKNTSNSSSSALFNVPVPSLSVSGGSSNESMCVMNRGQLVLLPQHTLVKQRLKSVQVMPPSKVPRKQTVVKPKSSTAETARKAAAKVRASKPTTATKSRTKNSSNHSSTGGNESIGPTGTSEASNSAVIVPQGSSVNSSDSECVEEGGLEVDPVAKASMDVYGECVSV